MIAETAMYLALFFSQSKYLAETSRLMDRLNKDGYKEVVEIVKDQRFRLFDPSALRKKANKVDLTDPKKHRYMTDESIQKSLDFIEKQKEWLDKAEELFPDIKREHIAAVLNIESYFGKNMGSYPAINALFSSYVFTERKDLFYEYITELLKFAGKNDIKDIFQLTGSFDGGMTPAQLMPTNLRKYAYDLDGDGFELNGIEDAIGSCGNMLHDKRKGGDILQALNAYNGAKYANAVNLHAQRLMERLSPPLTRKPPVVRKIPTKN